MAGGRVGNLYGEPVQAPTLGDSAPTWGEVPVVREMRIDKSELRSGHGAGGGQLSSVAGRTEGRDNLAEGGWKYDTGKTPYELLPYWFLEGTARVLSFGAQKYAAWNWYRGLAWGRVFGALMRHLWAWWWAKTGVGAERDAETGMSHLWHAACCLAFLIEFEAEQIGADDRPERGIVNGS